jgi:ATP:ADP antiporter, AAA family
MTEEPTKAAVITDGVFHGSTSQPYDDGYVSHDVSVIRDRIGTRDPRSIMARMLASITEVRPSEVVTALLLCLNSLLLLSAYACIKPVREVFVLALPSGAEYKIYMAGTTALTLLLAVPLYAKVASRLSRNRLLVWVTLFFASHLLIFYGVGTHFGATRVLGLTFYLWISVFNMIIVAQFWGFANDIYSQEAGRRLFPLLGLGASIGAVAGSAVAKELIGAIGPLPLLLVSGAILLASAAIVEVVHRREALNAEPPSLRARALSPVGGSAHEAFTLVFRNRYLTLIAGFSLLFTLVKTNGDYILAKLVADAAHAGADGHVSTQAASAYIGSFYADFNLCVDLVSLLLQAFVVSRLVKRAGLAVAFFVMPLLALADAAAIILLPLLTIVTAGKVAVSAVDYSLNNTVRNMLWLPTARRAKYLAKQTVDTFFVRMGDVVSVVLVVSAVGLLGLDLRTFAICNLFLILSWIWLARLIVREPVNAETGE